MNSNFCPCVNLYRWQWVLLAQDACVSASRWWDSLIGGYVGGPGTCLWWGFDKTALRLRCKGTWISAVICFSTRWPRAEETSMEKRDFLCSLGSSGSFRARLCAFSIALCISLPFLLLPGQLLWFFVQGLAQIGQGVGDRWTPDSHQPRWHWQSRLSCEIRSFGVRGVGGGNGRLRLFQVYGFTLSVPAPCLSDLPGSVDGHQVQSCDKLMVGNARAASRMGGVGGSPGGWRIIWGDGGRGGAGGFWGWRRGWYGQRQGAPTALYLKHTHNASVNAILHLSSQ